jgi:hypothetical protein
MDKNNILDSFTPTSKGINMGIYYFAVDYGKKEQMWSPKSFSDKCIYCPTHPLPHMIALKNCKGSNFQIVNDFSTTFEHEFKDVSNDVYLELKEEFPDFDWITYEK